MTLGFSPSALAQPPEDDEFVLTEAELPPVEAPDDEDLRLREVVVTGTRREQPVADLPVAVEVITQEEIQRSGTETLDELLEEQGGVQVFESFRGRGVRLRGLSPEHTLILIDGERTIGRIDGTLDLTRYPLDDVERVEIVRGASSALWGSDAIGGVINVIMREPSPTERDADWNAQARATYGTQDRRRSNRRDRFQGGPRIDDDVTLPRDGYAGTYDATGRFGYARRRGGFDVTLGYHRLDGYDLDPRDAATSAPDTDTIDASFAGRLQLGIAKLHLRAEMLHRDDVLYETRGPRVVFERRNQTDTAGASLSSDIRVRGRGTLHVRGAYRRWRDQFLRRVVGQAQTDPTTRTTQQIGQLQLRYVHPFSDDHIFTVGYDTSLERLDTQRLSRTGTRARVAPYLQHEWTVSSAPYVSIVPGLRIDGDSWFGSAVSPKLAVRVDPHPKLVLRASGGRGFRAPDFRELLLQFTENSGIGYVVYGNPDLRPETSWSIDGGPELRLDRVWLAATGYVHWVDDLITTDLVEVQDGVSRYGYLNIGRARTRGVETRARIHLLPSRGAHRLRADVSYTFLDARDRESQRALPGRSRHMGTLHLRYEHRTHGLRALVRSSLNGARTFFPNEDEVIEAEPYLSLDLRVEKSVLDGRLRMYAGVDNVMNNGGIYLGARPRTFWFGIAARRGDARDDDTTGAAERDAPGASRRTPALSSSDRP